MVKLNDAHPDVSLYRITFTEANLALASCGSRNAICLWLRASITGGGLDGRCEARGWMHVPDGG